MVRVALLRVATAPLQIVGLVALVFMLLHLTSGDPAYLMAGAQATGKQVADMRHYLGTDKPLMEQFWVYLVHMFHGDLGQSLQTSNPVLRDLLQRAPATLTLILLAIILIAVISLVLVGLILARPDGVVRRVTSMYAFAAGALPDFWVGLVLISVVFTRLGLGGAPTGQLDPRMSVASVTNVAFVDALLAGDWAVASNAAGHLLLPVATLTFVYMAPVVRLLSVVATRTLSSDYIRFADSWGIRRRRRVWFAIYHAFPTFIVTLSTTLVYLLGGAVLVETVFSWGGIGQYAVDAVTHSDFAAVQGFVIVAGVFTIVIYALGDIGHAAVDPTTRRRT